MGGNITKRNRLIYLKIMRLILEHNIGPADHCTWCDVPSKFGKLKYITINADGPTFTMLTRFDEPALARLLNCNSFSGVWNHHLPKEVGPQLAARHMMGQLGRAKIFGVTK